MVAHLLAHLETGRPSGRYCKRFNHRGGLVKNVNNRGLRLLSGPSGQSRLVGLGYIAAIRIRICSLGWVLEFCAIFASGLLATLFCVGLRWSALFYVGLLWAYMGWVRIC